MEGSDAEALVFPSPQGSVLRVQNFRRRCFDRAATKTGVPKLVPHELRHTAASLAIAAGASVKSVQRMLGHASATLTLDRYGHLFPDELDAVAVRLDEAVRESGVYRMCTPADPTLFDNETQDYEKAV
ncbi:MAG: tyrosine-type recombinase/integrase [Nocardioidaceae bacterium]